MIGALLGGIGGMISSGMNYSSQQSANRYNYAMHQQNLQFQKDAWNQSRQDQANAVQTRVADLENAGLNKALAMGSAAGVSSAPPTSPFQAQAPTMENPLAGFGGLTGVAGEIASLITMKENIAQTQAQTDLIRAQVDNERMRTANISGDTDLKKQQTRSAKMQSYSNEWDTYHKGLEYDQKKYDFELSKTQGRRANDSRSLFDQTTGAMMGTIDSTIKGLTSIAQSATNAFKKRNKRSKK